MEQSRVLKSLSAMAHDTRLEIVRLLVARGDEGMAAGAISDALGVSASGLSFHLSQLETAGLLTSRKASRHVIYAANRAALGGVIAYLLNDCCARDPDICACASENAQALG
ncbi:winged helix-turn-helix domain-containing protein [Aliiroseovarius sp. S1339]|uniref:ArsR/SmtB family transcription factor n=1 Tax=Aliiroseovarius sp. S1339 TaxID=2936990 RepID=UPI0020BDC7DB|nr:winged helix-turn-helix domain-containing protein [Aliiroseovarius sp. S1339]MCK8462621.1 winged helix-turn-helix domain-containing protein [Aliiroseovarius sp. S1339]